MQQQAAQRKYDGIEGLTARDPVGAVLTIGTKAPSGNPTETDRFYFKVPHSSKSGDQLQKPLHPGFAAYNGAPAEKRQTLSGNLVHGSREQAFEYRLSAQVLGAAWEPWPRAHPNRRPICSGDGARATRLYGIGEDGVEDWREIECPNERCQFRLGKGPKACKPAMRFLFRPRWRDGSPLPTPLTLLASHSWYSTAAFLGFFDYVESQARLLGLAAYSLFGLPFTLTLSMKTKATDKARFPVLSISPDVDLITFFLAQRRDLDALGVGVAPLAIPAALTDPDLADPARVADDFAEIVPGPAPAKPSNPSRIDTTGDNLIDAAPVDERPAGLLSRDALARLRAAAEVKGISDELLGRLAGGALDEAPASAELEILRAISTYRASKAK